ncbi:MAG: hypothetical protein GY757_44530 [bacterium]|nr:hypothetical protein [bacterium]
MKKNKGEDILLAYLKECDHPFTLADFFKATGVRKTKKSETEFGELIQCTDYFVLHKRKFHPRHCFLQDIPFRIEPTAFEIREGILVPGHRMLPFHPFGFIMDGVTFKWKNSKIKPRTKSFKMEELQVYFRLMDLQKVPIQNIEAILEEGADLEIQVCDMASFYKKNNFQEGDSIIVKPLNFREGTFFLKYDPLENFETHILEIEKVNRKFLSVLRKVIDTNLVLPNVEKQLLYTYFYLRDDVVSIPGSSLETLLDQNLEISFASLPNGRTIFHFSNQDFEDIDAYPHFKDYLENGDEELDFGTIDGILQYLENNNNIVVVRALLLDLITDKKRFNYTKIENYLFEGLNKPYMPMESRKLFKFLVHEEYKELKKVFNPAFAYLPITTARKRVLDELLMISKFLRSLDSRRVRLEDLPKNDMMHLMELDRALTEVLDELEVSQLEEKDNSKEIHQVLKMVERMSYELPAIFNLIDAKVRKKS